MLSVHGTSTDQKTIEALRLVKDYLNLHGGVSKIKVCKDLIKRCSMARRYEEDLKAQRALKKYEEEAKKEKTEKEEASVS